NEKIEGFFEVCLSKGLTGEQGVIIPHQNIKNLMLKDKVLEAVKDGKFHIYAIRNISEGMEILTNKTAGVKNSEGVYPANTIFFKVANKLNEYVQKSKQHESKSIDI